MRYLVTILTLAGLAAVAAAQNTATSASSPATTAAAHKAKADASLSSSATPVAIQKALELPEGAEQTKALKAAAVEWQKSDPAAALAWAVARTDAMPKSMLYRSVVGAVSQAWAKRDAPAAVAFAWGLAKKPILAGNEMGAFHLSLVEWSMSDPKAAVAWSETTVPADSSKDILYFVYMSIADGWARVDPAASAAWAEAVKNVTNRQSAVWKTADIWCRSKPEDAAVWAKRLPPGDLKSAVRPIFETLYHRDAAKATAWLDSLNLPDETKAELKKKAESMKPKP